MRSLLLLALAAALASAHDVSKLPGVIWHAPFMSGGGYCSEALTFFQALTNAGVTIEPRQHGDALDKAFVSVMPSGLKRSLEMAHVKANLAPQRSITICHSEPGAWAPPLFKTSPCPQKHAGYVVGRTMFETDSLPDGWAERLNGMDEVWVPTAFSASVFRDGGVEESKLHIVPEPVDTALFDPAAVSSPMMLPGDDWAALKLLSVFKWEERKGWDILLRAYFQEFKPEEKTILYLLTAPYHGAPDFHREIYAFAEDELGLKPEELPRLEVLSPGLPTADMPSLYAAADAFVLPSHGEGWGRPHVEAMAMALPVIATAWSGPTEFMTDDNSYPLPIEDELVEVQSEHFQGHRWAQPDEQQLRALMRRVLEQPEEAKAKGVRARQDMLTRFAPAVVAEKVIDELARIQASRPQQLQLTTASARHYDL